MNKYIYYYYSEKKEERNTLDDPTLTHVLTWHLGKIILLIISIDFWNSIWRHAIDTCSRDEQVNAHHKVRIGSLKIKSGMSESKILELWCLEPVTTLDLTLHLHKNIEHQYWKLFLRSQHWDLMYLYMFKTHNSYYIFTLKQTFQIESYVRVRNRMLCFLQLS